MCFLNTVKQVLYSLPAFRDCINKVQPPVKGVAMKIRKHFSEIVNSSELVKTSFYVRYLGVQHEPGIQFHLRECLLQLLAKIYHNRNDDCMFKISKLESTLFNNCGRHTTKMVMN